MINIQILKSLKKTLNNNYNFNVIHQKKKKIKRSQATILERAVTAVK